MKMGSEPSCAFNNPGLFMFKLHAAVDANPFLGLEAAGGAAQSVTSGELQSQFASSDLSAGHGPKSALDDLNESIRQAMSVRSTSPGLSSSPAKQIGGGGGH